MNDEKQQAVASPIEPVVMCSVPPDWATHYYLAFGDKIWVKKEGNNYTYVNYGLRCSLHDCYVKQLIELNT